jgi:hypothetical protein
MDQRDLIPAATHKVAMSPMAMKGRGAARKVHWACTRCWNTARTAPSVRQFWCWRCTYRDERPAIPR